MQRIPLPCHDFKKVGASDQREVGTSDRYAFSARGHCGHENPSIQLRSFQVPLLDHAQNLSVVHRNEASQNNREAVACMSSPCHMSISQGARPGVPEMT